MPLMPDAPPLTQLYCYLTEGCNLACRHCWLAPHFDPTGTHWPTLPVAQFEEAVHAAQPLGLQRIKLTGGEPLLHPQFGQIVDIIRRESLALTIETNGLLFTPAWAAQIASIPERFVSVSLDGVDAATHDGIRGVPGSFERACQALVLLVAANIAPQIIMSLLPENLDQIEPMVRLAERIGVSSVKFNILQPTGRGEQMYRGQQGLAVETLIKTGQYVDTVLVSTSPVELFFDYPLAFQPLRRIARENGRGRCGILHILGVLPNGTYALCGIGKHTPDLVFGAVETTDLAQIWREHPTLQALRQGLPDRLDGICRDCLMQAQCLGSCVAQNYYRTGQFWAPFWFCEQADQAGLFPKTRLK